MGAQTIAGVLPILEYFNPCFRIILAWGEYGTVKSMIGQCRRQDNVAYGRSGCNNEE